MTLSKTASQLLDTFDQVANSNTLLIDLESSEDVGTALRRSCTNGALEKALLQADIDRDWYNFHQAGTDGEREACQLRLSTPQVESQMSASEFQNTLVDLLMSGRSFYNRGGAER